MDKLLVNGNVITMNPQQPRAEAIAIAGERIAAVGPTAELRAGATAGTNVIDLRGRTVCPGFIDAHCHFSIAALEPVSVDCHLSSVAAIVAAVRAAAGALQPGQWLRGYGYDEMLLAERRHPTRQELDAVCPNNPLLLLHWSVHRCVANTAALELAGIGRQTPDPSGGLIQRDPHGEPTGLLYESASNALVRLAAAAYAEQLGERMTDLIEQHARLWLSRGVTAVHDAATTPAASAHFQAALDAGKLPLRIYQMVLGAEIFRAPLERLDGATATGPAAARLRIGPLKLFVDGGGNSLALSYPTNGGLRRLGILFYGQDELNDLVLRAHRQGLQVAGHTAGNEGIAAALAAYRHALRVAPKADHRFRLEHASCMTDALLREAGELGVVVAVQPTATYHLGDQWLASAIPASAIRYLPLRSLLAQGLVVAGSSDYPCFAPEPLRAMSFAATRRTARGAVVGPEEAISVAEALTLYTSGAAYASFSEHEEGSLEPGKLANMLVLSADPLRTDLDELEQIAVEQTWLAGEVAYQRPA